MYSVRLLSFPLRLDEALKKRDILRDPALQEALICGVIATATDDQKKEHKEGGKSDYA